MDCSIFPVIWLLLFLVQDDPRIEDWEAAQRRFVEWQKSMVDRRIRIPQRSHVVPPLPACDADTDDHPYRVRFQSRFLPIPEFGLGVGQPTIELSAGAEASASKFVLFRHSLKASYSLKDNSLAFQNSAEAGASLSKVSGALTLSGMQVRPEARLGADFGIWTTGAAVNADGEVSLSGGVKLDPAAKVTGRLVRLGGSVDVSVSAPVVVTDVQWGSGFGLHQVASRVAVALSRILLPAGCEYCAAKGRIRCASCGDAGKIRCPTCQGTLRARCTNCGGQGFFDCPTTESCGSCRNGRLHCSTCGGTGSVTVTEWETCMWCDGKGGKMETVTETCPVCRGRGGIDFDGDGSLDSSCDATIEKDRWLTCSQCSGGRQRKDVRQACGSCGGTGDGGVCGACGGDGHVTCRRCGGSGERDCGSCVDGWVRCDRCRGTGSIVCPTCGGRPISCPLCAGKKRVGSEPALPKPAIASGVKTNPAIARIWEKLSRKLPPGTYLTSGVRDAEDQLRIIERYSRKAGLLQPGESLSLKDPKWKDVYGRLYATGRCVVNPPETVEVGGKKIGPSPHFRGDCLDLSGSRVRTAAEADRQLEAILKAVREAEKDPSGAKFRIVELKKELKLKDGAVFQKAVHLQFRIE